MASTFERNLFNKHQQFQKKQFVRKSQIFDNIQVEKTSSNVLDFL